MHSYISSPFAARTLVRPIRTRSLVSLAAMVALPALHLQGEEVTQSRAFSVTKTASGTGTLVVSDTNASGTNGLLGTAFTPFDPSLGTLTSFTITWNTTLTASGTVSPSASGAGALDLQIGGNFFLNSDNYSGTGGGGGNGGGPGSVINPVVSTAGETKVFQVAGAGTAYNPAFLTAVTGTAGFSLSYRGGSPGSLGNLAQITYSALSNLTATYEGSVTLTYTYTPPQPVSATLNGASGSVPYSTNYSTNTGLILSLGFDAEYLVVAGGGGGGTAPDNTAHGNGGGGAGGMRQGAFDFLTADSYLVGVGAGGAAGTSASPQGKNGADSKLADFIATGGGGGGRFQVVGGAGGSGGGGGGRGTGTNLRTAGGAGVAGQGYAGGASRDDNSSGRSAGGGGGGAGGLGGDGAENASIAGNGGTGLVSSIGGTSVTYAGGGGGGARDTQGGTQTAGTGGTGGGGAGSTTGNATNGTNGLGGGGGGAGSSGLGGTGGSGLVVVRYLGAPAGTGGIISEGTGSATGYTLHTFSSVGETALIRSSIVANDRLGAVMNGTLSGTGNFTFNGPGSLTLAAANTFSGDTIINAGRIVLGNSMALQNSTLDTSSAGHIDANGLTTLTLGGLKGSTALATLFGSSYSSITTLRLSAGSADTHYSGVIADGATGMDLAKFGSHTQTLTGNNTYTGSTTIWDGILAVGGHSIPDTGDVFIYGGKLAATGTEIVAALYFNGARQPLGTYGATGSGATYIDDIHFSGTAGVVQVTEGLPASFTATSGSPSASQSLTVRDHGYSGILTVTAPANFEVSTDGSSFASSVILGSSAGAIHVRLAATAPTGAVSGDLSVSSSGVAAQIIALSGTMFAVIAPSTEVLGSFATDSGTASASQSFTVNGIGVNSAVTLTAPAGFEVSTDGVNYSSNVTLGTRAGSIQTVYRDGFNKATGNVWESGSGHEFPNEGAFAALKADGSVVAWGESGRGGDSTSAAANLASGVTAIYSNRYAFAALKTDGSVVTWGNSWFGGDLTGSTYRLWFTTYLDSISNVKAVYSNSGAFAALKNDGSVVTWGYSQYGGDSSNAAADLASGVKTIFSTRTAFAALKTDGSVVTWGSGSGGDSSHVAQALASNVISIYSNEASFAAIKSDGSVVTWGDNAQGGDSTEVASQLTSGVKSIFSNRGAFAALKQDGSVVTWGYWSEGGHSTSVASQLTSNVASIFATESAFAAVKNDGSVVTWGSAQGGGDSSAVAASLTSGVISVYSTQYAFAAVKSDGSLVTWGNSDYGGNSASVAARLSSGVAAVYSNQQAFAALKNDGSLVAWGYAGAAAAADLATNVTGVYSTRSAFVALKNDGKLVTWGTYVEGDPGNINLPPALPATIHVRLASTAAVGSVSGNLTLTSSVATTRTVALSGTVTAVETHTHQELWRFANFGSYDSVDSGADSADPDHDGLNNLLEYALGTAPSTSGVMPAVLALNGANLEYTYTRSTAAKDNGVTYQIEWSETLGVGSWSTEMVTQQITSTQGALETVKASVPAGTGGKRFLRLRVGSAPLQTP